MLAKEEGETAQTTYDQAQAMLESARSLVISAQTNITALQAQVEVANSQRATALAQVKQAEASLKQAEVDLENTVIRAPVDGVVVARQIDVGQTVAASMQAPTLFSIAQDLTRMQVDTNVSEADVGRVVAGQAADFTVDAYPGQVFHGKVTSIRKAPINVQNVVTYDVVIGVANPDLKLFPGMTANVKILIDRHKDVLKVPNAALRFHPADAAPRKTQRPAAGAGGGTASRRKRAADGVGDGRREQEAASGAGDGRYHRRELHGNQRRRPEGRRPGDCRGVFEERRRRGVERHAVQRRRRRRGRGTARRILAMDPLIQLEHLVKDYRMGGMPVHALKGVSLSIERGRVRGDHGPVRLGQVDDDEHPGLPGQAHLRECTGWTGSRWAS